MPTLNNGVLDGVRRITAKVRDLIVDGGLPGAPLGYRLRGATASGAPQSGTWRAGDVVPDRAGCIWICIAGGTPGTWALAGAAGTTVNITTTGSTFSPSVTLTAGSTATVYWISGGTVAATGLTPTISWNSAATRTVRMAVLDANGYNALSQVYSFNIGYSSANDPSVYAPSSSYNLASQAVSGVTGITGMTALVYFLAEQVTGITGTLDFSDLTQLTNIELYGSSGVQGVRINGCTSLTRLDIETCNLTTLDINQVPALYDLRGAAQSGGQLSLTPLNLSLVNQYHFCVRDQVVTGMPDPGTKMPVINQLWIWNARQQGTLTLNSTAVTDVNAHQNYFSAVSAVNQWPAWTSGQTSPTTNNPMQLLMSNNCLTSAILTGCPGLANIDLSVNPFAQSQVDSILATVDGFGTSNGTLNLGTTAAPSATGTTHKNNLTGRGWTVTVDASGSGGGGTKFTYKDSFINHAPAVAGYSLFGTLSQAVSAGDLLVAVIEAPGTPKVADTAGNTWTVLGPYQTYLYLAYCLSSAAASGGLKVGAYTNTPHLLAASRFTPAGTVTFGGTANNAPQSTGGAGNPLGDLGTVPAHALAWGAFVSDNTSPITYNTGFQTGTSGTANLRVCAWEQINGTCALFCVPDCANTDANMTFTGSALFSGMAVSAYFTST